MKIIVSYLIIALMSSVVLTGAGYTLKKSVGKNNNLTYVMEVYNSRIVNAFPKQEGVVAGIQQEKPEPVCNTEYILTELKGNNSIINYLRNRGESTTFGYRQVLAKQYNLPNYSGSADDNLLLLAKLQGLSACK